MLGPEKPDIFATFARLWPIRRFPILVDDGGDPVFEASIVIEYLQIHHPRPVALVPADPQKALDVRMLDRFFDHYVQTPMQKIVGDALRDQNARDPLGVAEARSRLDVAYAWLDGRMEGRTWAAADHFSLADCAAAPALFYADWVHPIDPAFTRVHAYRRRLLARPSFARAVEEARPYRSLFPLGAPDRD